MAVHSSLLAFPYHDPQGNLNALILKTLPELQRLFAKICISATPSTVAENGDFLDLLERNGCHIFRNAQDSCIGDHLRGAMHTALQHSRTIDIIHYLYIDRLLFALNTEHAEQFRHDIQDAGGPLTLWERSNAAWETHPSSYREIEKAANVFGKHLLGEEIELGSCGMSIRADFAARILPLSHMVGMDTATEWILLSYTMKQQPVRKQVDWLAWEDPFIEGEDAEKLKAEREVSAPEIHKRLQMNAPFALLTADPRFKNLLS